MTFPRFTPRGDTRPVDTPWPRLQWPPAADVRLRGRYVELSQAESTRDAEGLFVALDHDTVWRHIAGRPADAAGYAKLLDDGYAAGRLPWIVRLTVPYADLPAGAVVGASSYLDISA